MHMCYTIHIQAHRIHFLASALITVYWDCRFLKIIISQYLLRGAEASTLVLQTAQMASQEYSVSTTVMQLLCNFVNYAYMNESKFAVALQLLICYLEAEYSPDSTSM